MRETGENGDSQRAQALYSKGARKFLEGSLNISLNQIGHLINLFSYSRAYKYSGEKN